MFVHLCVRLAQNQPDLITAVGVQYNCRSSFVDIFKHTTFGRMDEQTWIETEFVKLLIDKIVLRMYMHIKYNSCICNKHP